MRSSIVTEDEFTNSIDGFEELDFDMPRKKGDSIMGGSLAEYEDESNQHKEQLMIKEEEVRILQQEIQDQRNNLSEKEKLIKDLESKSKDHESTT